MWWGCANNLSRQVLLNWKSVPSSPSLWIDPPAIWIRDEFHLHLQKLFQPKGRWRRSFFCKKILCLRCFPAPVHRNCSPENQQSPKCFYIFHTAFQDRHTEECFRNRKPYSPPWSFCLWNPQNLFHFHPGPAL